MGKESKSEYCSAAFFFEGESPVVVWTASAPASEVMLQRLLEALIAKYEEHGSNIDRDALTISALDKRVMATDWSGEIFVAPASDGDALVAVANRDEIEISKDMADILLFQLKTIYKLRTLASTDKLTGLRNRRHLDFALREHIETARRYKQTLAVAILDIDDFKDVNDERGHAFGDRLLCELARLLEKHMRDADLPVRYGGDEFVLVMPMTDRDGATVAIKRLLDAVAGFVFCDDGDGGVRISVSAGIAITGDDGWEANDLLLRADMRLLDAKL